MPKEYNHFKYIYSVLPTEQLDKRKVEIEAHLFRLNNKQKTDKEELIKTKAKLNFLNAELHKRSATK